MSRTFRRKKHKKHYSHFEEDYTYQYVDSWLGTTAQHKTWGAFPSIKLEGKKFSKAYHKYHGDTKHSWVGGRSYFEQEEASCRMRNKQELAKWQKKLTMR